MKPYEIATAAHDSEACAELLADGWEPFAVTVHTDTEEHYEDGTGWVCTHTGTFTDYVWFRRSPA